MLRRMFGEHPLPGGLADGLSTRIGKIAQVAERVGGVGRNEDFFAWSKQLVQSQPPVADDGNGARARLK